MGDALEKLYKKAAKWVDNNKERAVLATYIEVTSYSPLGMVAGEEYGMMKAKEWSGFIVGTPSVTSAALAAYGIGLLREGRVKDAVEYARMLQNAARTIMANVLKLQ